MKYYRWKLKWSVNPVTGGEEGTDPTFTVNNDSVRVDPLFSVPAENRSNEWYYVYGTKGALDLEELTDWSVEEITAEDMLNAAKSLDEAATLVDGYIIFPEVTKPE